MTTSVIVVAYNSRAYLPACLDSILRELRPGDDNDFVAWAQFAGMAAAVFCVAILSVIKATNEPLLSSKWTFYRPTELIALEWSNAHLQNENIWTEFDERLVTAWLTNQPQSGQANTFRGFHAGPGTRTLLVSDVTWMRSARFSRPLPIPPDALQVYDNGEAEMYHLRPLTPYQR